MLCDLLNDWPTKSPDINILENIWSILKSDRRRFQTNYEPLLKKNRIPLPKMKSHEQINRDYSKQGTPLKY